MDNVAAADWLNMPETRAVMAALEAGKQGGARFVGGCVRNTLMGRSVDDIDIATQLAPEDTLSALKTANIRAIPTGIEHGTVTAVVNHIPFEITSLRRDVETDGRRAVVAFTRDWAEDAQRRDFRLNAIYADASGKLYDPTGGGIEDASKGRVIFIGDGDQRLCEDYLRILRFFRFNAWYGAAIDAEGLAACARQKDGLAQIAAERIWKELKKTLAAPKPYLVMKAMQEAGVLAIILPECEHVDTLHDLEICEQLTGQKVDPMLRFMALLPATPLATSTVSGRLRLSNAEATRLDDWARAHMPEPKGLKAPALRASLYQHGARALIDRFMLSGRDVRDVVAASHIWRRPVFPVMGEDLLNAGLKPGPAVGDALRDMEAWWIESDFAADKTELLDALERQMKAD